jgi:hypothetical protein
LNQARQRFRLQGIVGDMGRNDLCRQAQDSVIGCIFVHLIPPSLVFGPYSEIMADLQMPDPSLPEPVWKKQWQPP